MVNSTVGCLIIVLPELSELVGLLKGHGFKARSTHFKWEQDQSHSKNFLLAWLILSKTGFGKFGTNILLLFLGLSSGCSFWFEGKIENLSLLQNCFKHFSFHYGLIVQPNLCFLCISDVLPKCIFLLLMLEVETFRSACKSYLLVSILYSYGYVKLALM